MSKFYVYRHTRLDSNTPFYVGKGTVIKYYNRAYDFKYRSNLHKRITNKHGCKVNIIKYFNNEQIALDFEQKLIKLYKAQGHCEANFTAGGEGLSGFRHSKETKLKIARANTGVSKSKKSRKLMAQKQIEYYKSPGARLQRAIWNGAKPFDVFKNNVFVGSWTIQKECCRCLGLTRSHVSLCLHGKRKTHKGFTFNFRKE